MRVGPRAIRSSTFIIAVGTALAVSGCGSGAVEFQGSEVENADEVLSNLDGLFDEIVDDQVSAGTATISDESRCYLSRDGDDSIGESAYCGPARAMSATDDEHWLEVTLTENGTTDEGLRLTVEPPAAFELTATDADGLFRPDGEEPVAADSLDEPEAPEAPVEDYAALVSRDVPGLDAEFSELDEPHTLVTPSLTMTVEASADLDVIPDGVILSDSSADEADDMTGRDESAESEDSGDDAPFYSPADGQQVRAWEVTLGPSPEMAPDLDEYDSLGFGGDSGRDASTALAVKAGNQRLVMHGSLSDDSDESDTLTVACPDVPCMDIDQQRAILFTSAAEDTDLSLVTTVDGQDQAVSLDDGTLTSEVSKVAYDREQLTQQVSTAWPSTTFLISAEDDVKSDVYCCDDITYTFGGEVQKVFLTPFDLAQGWAPDGKAWLVVPIANRPDELVDGNADISIDEAKSITLSTGGETLPSMPEAGDSDVTVFQVDSTFTEGTITYSPVGSAKVSGGETFPIKTDEPLTLDVAFP